MLIVREYLILLCRSLNEKVTDNEVADMTELLEEKTQAEEQLKEKQIEYWLVLLSAHNEGILY